MGIFLFYFFYYFYFISQLEAKIMDMQAQLAAGFETNDLKVELEEAQRSLKTEQEARAKLTNTNQALEKVSK